MHKLQNYAGHARQGWERMQPSLPFSISRSHSDMNSINPPLKRPSAAAANSPGPGPGSIVTLSFNIPFSAHLAGPEVDDVIYGSPGAFLRWTHPEGTPEGTPTHKLPIHANNVEELRLICKRMTETSDGRLVATVVSTEPKPTPGLQRGPLKTVVTNVCLYGEYELVQRMRETLLNSIPICLRRETIDIDDSLVFDAEQQGVKSEILNHLDGVARETKTDIFLLHPKHDAETASLSGAIETGTLDSRLRCYIYGDMEQAMYAKTRVLVMIDQILHHYVDIQRLELSMHTLICGRGRKNIKIIESTTNTAIYFPPPFPTLFGYRPAGAVTRDADQVIITGKTRESILQAKRRLHDLVLATKSFVKEIAVTVTKIDSIILERLDKVRKIMENNGSYVLLPRLGMQRGVVRIQGTDVLHVERTAREVMAIAGQFYGASWWINQPNARLQQPTPQQIPPMLADICINSGADITFEGLNFHITGSDDSVKAALTVMNNIPFVNGSTYTLRVKIELANEHKEFVSGKKNGKINKIMSQTNVQIVFDGFNEYNFYIDVRGQQYDAIKSGLDLVEQEMPASISFHVPDQYHKRIIGIGGSHIQRIMKKYSVFVKFSNAMDRGGHGREEDDIKMDNVICRTPARNAQNLDLVKTEIMDMVARVDADHMEEQVVINRLYHRELVARMSQIEDLEKKWNCTIHFPGAEEASDVVTIKGPEYQLPQIVDEFLGMVPERHEIAFDAPPELKEYLRSSEYQNEVVEKMKSQYEVEIRLGQVPTELSEATNGNAECLVFNFTRNAAGGLKDAIDFLIARLVPHGLDAETVKGTIARPKSDSFEESLPFFESKLLHRVETPVMTDSPTRSAFNGDEANGETSNSFFSKIRKPGSMSSFTSFIDRRKTAGSNSPGSVFKHASSNASKASLISIESQGSYRNPWNDSSLQINEEGHTYPNNQSSTSLHHSNGWSSTHPHPPRSSENGHSKFPFGASISTIPGDATPRYDPRAIGENGRPSTSHSISGYPGPIGPPR